MKQQSKPTISNPMSSSTLKKRGKNDQGGVRISLLVGIPLTVLLLVILGVFFDMAYTTKKDPFAFVGVREALFVHSGDAKPNKGMGQQNQKELLIISTKHGNIKIVLRPDLSKESVQYIKSFVAAGDCSKCQFYRSEKDLLLQGMIKNPTIQTNKIYGKCPDTDYKPKVDCPKHDPDCGCHGPIMTKGMVGWAGGSSGGPDFFINTFKKPVDWWDHQHTVWGELQDDESFSIIDHIYTLPVTKKGLMMLDEKIDFTVKITSESSTS